MAVHSARKARLVDFVRRRLRRQFLRHGEGHWKLTQVEEALNPNALTLGFARRFATYKRATLIFQDTERLKRLLNDPERPVQVVFAGKSHPADEMGQGSDRAHLPAESGAGFFLARSSLSKTMI